MDQEKRSVDKTSNELPSDCRPFIGIDPHAGRERNLYLRIKEMDRAVRLGPGRAKELAYTLCEVALKPTAIFKGVNDEGEPDWFCYIGVPDMAYDYRTGESRRAWPGKVFFIIVDEFYIHQLSGWELADDTDSKLPANYQTRFGERLI